MDIETIPVDETVAEMSSSQFQRLTNAFVDGPEVAAEADDDFVTMWDEEDGETQDEAMDN